MYTSIQQRNSPLNSFVMKLWYDISFNASLFFFINNRMVLKYKEEGKIYLESTGHDYKKLCEKFTGTIF